MSGGHFNYEQYHINDILDNICDIIENNDSKEKDEFGCLVGFGFSKEVIEKFKEAVVTLDRAFNMAHRIDWLVSGDDSEESFLERWEEDVGD